MSRDGAMMNTDIGLILDLVRDIGIKESRKGLDKISKKLIGDVIPKRNPTINFDNFLNIYNKPPYFLESNIHIIQHSY